jgi:CRP-like cAMP-binding protein
MNGNQESPQLFGAYFQRALGNERLGHIERAIEDYGTCIRIDANASAAYFNRSALYYASERYEEALHDLDRAISLNPSNREYRLNRALAARRLGNFADAIKDTIVSRALISNPELFNGVENPENAPVPEGEAGLLLSAGMLVDPVRTCLRRPKLSRPEDSNFEETLKFLSGLKMFQGLAVDRSILCTMAQCLVLAPLEAGEVLFDEGAPADKFYVVYEGVVSIFKKARGADKVNVQTLVEFGSGSSFGDANLEESRGVRTAGAMAKKRSLLLSMTGEEFRSVMSDLRRMVRAEVKRSLVESKVFKSWSPDNIEKLASKSVRLSFNAGKDIINAGDVASHLYLILRGVVKITKPVLRSKLFQDSDSLGQAPSGSGADGSPGSLTQPSSGEGSSEEATGLWVRDLSWQSRLDMDDNEYRNVDLKDPKDFIDCNVCVVSM